MGVVEETKILYTKQKQPILFVYISPPEDPEKRLLILYFNNPTWVHNQANYYRDHKTKLFFSGKLGTYSGKRALIHAEIHEYFEDYPILPVYKTSKELKNVKVGFKAMTTYLINILSKMEIKDPFSEYIHQKYHLIPLYLALKSLHLPLEMKLIRQAQYRVKFDEIFYLQLFFKMLTIKRENLSKNLPKNSFILKTNGPLVKKFLEGLEFPLTNDQKKVIQEIIDDVSEGGQMNRLIQGDVGCGKTIIAIVSLLMAVDSGYQGVFVAPTEILADQHYSALVKFLGTDQVKLLVGGTKKKDREGILSSLALGSAKICVCTHTILNDTTVFQDIGLVVIDEFCKFGVLQRNKMLEKGVKHLLIMSATPIPRSLGLTIYGDLKISSITELPSQRKKILTTILEENQRDKMHQMVLEELEKGHQVYIVHPLVQERSDALKLRNLKGVENCYREILNNPIFKDYQIGLIHGKMESYVKEEEMRKFKEKKTQILMATTVIEVGVDVPNATVIVIENSERYGLSQLHQLRGRVGRGSQQSYCVLMKGNSKSDELINYRLTTIANNSCGFKISEMDLKIRGPGDMVGVEQSGFISSHFRLFDFSKDDDIMTKSKDLVEEIIIQDPELISYPLIKKNFEKLATNWNLGEIF